MPSHRYLTLAPRWPAVRNLDDPTAYWNSAPGLSQPFALTVHGSTFFTLRVANEQSGEDFPGRHQRRARDIRKAAPPPMSSRLPHRDSPLR